MKKYFYKSLDFLLFSNIFIALGAVAQGLVTYHLLDAKPENSVLAFLFFSTLTIYNFSILLKKPIDFATSPYRRVRWIFSHYRLNISITLVSVLSLIPLFFLLSFNAKILLFFLGFISFGYGFPLFKIKNSKIALRNIPGLKLFLIAFVWSISTVALPIVEINETHYSVTPFADIIILCLKRFLFVAAITVPFDIRDLFQDQSYNLKTIPTIFGEQKAYFFCQILLLGYIILLFLFNNNFDNDFFALTFTILLTGWLIFKSDWKKNEYYYFCYLDGTLILQWIFLAIFNLYEYRY